MNFLFSLLINFLSYFIGSAMVVSGLINFFDDTTFKAIITLGMGCIILLLVEIKDKDHVQEP